jgi:hypothetical protein
MYVYALHARFPGEVSLVTANCSLGLVLEPSVEEARYGVAADTHQTAELMSFGNLSPRGVSAHRNSVLREHAHTYMHPECKFGSAMNNRFR